MATTYRIAKFNYDKEVNDVNAKTYATKQDATNAGNSWVNDCTVHTEIRKGSWFDVYEVKQKTENVLKLKP